MPTTHNSTFITINNIFNIICKIEVIVSYNREYNTWRGFGMILLTNIIHADTTYHNKRLVSYFKNKLFTKSIRHHVYTYTIAIDTKSIRHHVYTYTIAIVTKSIHMLEIASKCCFRRIQHLSNYTTMFTFFYY